LKIRVYLLGIFFIGLGLGSASRLSSGQRIFVLWKQSFENISFALFWSVRLFFLRFRCLLFFTLQFIGLCKKKSHRRWGFRTNDQGSNPNGSSSIQRRLAKVDR